MAAVAANMHGERKQIGVFDSDSVFDAVAVDVGARQIGAGRRYIPIGLDFRPQNKRSNRNYARRGAVAGGVLDDRFFDQIDRIARRPRLFVARPAVERSDGAGQQQTGDDEHNREFDDRIAARRETKQPLCHRRQPGKAVIGITPKAAMWPIISLADAQITMSSKSAMSSRSVSLMSKLGRDACARMRNEKMVVVVVARPRRNCQTRRSIGQAGVDLLARVIETHAIGIRKLVARNRGVAIESAATVRAVRKMTKTAPSMISPRS